MDIKDFKPRKQQLESDIVLSISKLISEFKEDTGYSPSNICISMTTIWTGGDEYDYFVGGATTEIKI